VVLTLDGYAAGRAGSQVIATRLSAKCAEAVASSSYSRHRLTPLDFPPNLSKGMSLIHLKVNGRNHSLELDPATPLLYVLSDDLGLRGPKFGCGLGQCGACTVIIKGQATRSCITPVKSVGGVEIITLDSIGTIEKPHPIQKAFIEEQAAQCGFCLNGVIMTAKAFLDKNPKASEAEIRQAMSGIICRCFTSIRMLRAIQRAGREMAR
jgi:nicotinate dehydrogenase subunit A